MKVLSLLLVIAFGYGYLLYPVLLWLLSRKTHRSSAASRDEAIKISLLVPVFDAEDVIADKIRNCLELDYPQDRLQLIFISDACTDNTETIITEHPAIKLLIQAERSGKESCLQQAITLADGDIICFTDVCTLLPAESLRKIAGRFADPDIGVVSSHDADVVTGVSLERLHIGFEMMVRELESAVTSSVGASGSFFAARAPIARQLSHERSCSDLEISLAAVRLGYRAIHDPELYATYTRSVDIKMEFWRQVRIITHGINTVSMNADILNPLRYGLFSWQVTSHKLVRWTIPLLTLAWLLVGMFHLPDLLQASHIMIVAAGLASVAILDWSLNSSRVTSMLARNTCLAVIYVLCVITALTRIICGRRYDIWAPTQRKQS